MITDKYMYEQIKKPTGNAFLRYEFETGHIEDVLIADEAVPTYPIDDEEVARDFINSDKFCFSF